MPGLRPERPGAGSDRGPEHLKTSPRPHSLHSAERTEAANDIYFRILLEVLNTEARELEGRIAENVAMLLERAG
jgi:hypothetical protein